MDSDLKMEVWNWLDIQQSTGYNKRNRDELGSRNRDGLGLQSLSGGFRRRFRNQNFTSRPNAMQSQYDSTINLRERKVKHSTINPQKKKVKDILIASSKNKIITKIVIPEFLATVQTKPNQKKRFIGDCVGSSITTFPSTIPASCGALS